MLTVRDLIPWNRERDVAAGRAGEHPLMSFQRDMNRMFEDLWRGFDAPFLGRSEALAATMISPRIELKETEDAIVVSAELPGLKESDVEITLSDNVLNIRGEKKTEMSEEKESGYTYSERSYGAFERRIPIEAEVVAERVEAAFADGVLTVTCPKNPEAKTQPRRIPIGGTAKVEHKPEDKSEPKVA